jgi:general nucleoside transport system ATP-binding protein
MPESEKKSAVLSLTGITKAFPGVLANDAIDLDIFPGEIHALLGENGAGKSTLMKILYGYYKADSGSILLHGNQVQIQSPNDARRYHIGMVFQEFMLIPAFTVAENIALFLPELKAIYKPEEISREIKKLSQNYQLEVNPDVPVSQLTVGEQQKVELLKLLFSKARILILDEPTRVLAPHEVEALFQVLDNLKQAGYAIILITHKMNEVLQCADRITVLRGGKVAGTRIRSAVNEQVLVQMMFEKELARLDRPQAIDTGGREPLVQLQDVDTKGDGIQVSLKDIHLEVYPGEIVGVAGVSGNGQRELGDLVLGLEKIVQGRKILFGQDATNWSVRRIRKSGVAFIPENPLLMAAAPWMTVLQNSILTRMWRYVRMGGLQMDWETAQADITASFDALKFPMPFLYAPSKALSGGNLQRLIIARELAFAPKLIIASYLTRGLDVQSTIAARQALLNARTKGAGVLLISEDLEELFALSDRIVVLFAGRMVGNFHIDEADIYRVGHLMTGSEVEHVPSANP